MTGTYDLTWLSIFSIFYNIKVPIMRRALTLSKISPPRRHDKKGKVTNTTEQSSPYPGTEKNNVRIMGFFSLENSENSGAKSCFSIK